MRRFTVFTLSTLAVVIAGIAGAKWWRQSLEARAVNTWSVTAQPFQLHFTAMGTIAPRNKVSVASPVAGRVEKIFVEEGVEVKKNQLLAEISSTDRVALLEAARQGANDPEMKKLLTMYRPTPIRAPLNGRVLLKKLIQGQTVTSENVLYEISDELIVVAKVDESDIGHVSLRQHAKVRVDAFPRQDIVAAVERVGEQSTTNHGVTSYEVFLTPAEQLPNEFKAGMSVNVELMERSAPNVTVLPVWIVEGRKNSTAEIKVQTVQGAVAKRLVQLGESNGEFVEVLSGLDVGEVVIYKILQYLEESKSVPFGLMEPKKK